MHKLLRRRKKCVASDFCFLFKRILLFAIEINPCYPQKKQQTLPGRQHLALWPRSGGPSLEHPQSRRRTSGQQVRSTAFHTYFPGINLTIHSPTLARFSRALFAFVARRSGSAHDNQCHVFCELEPAQPATAITSFANKVIPGIGNAPARNI